MKRYLAADMRSALRAIREEQGPDAVILSSKPTSSGVEVCAAVDIELAVGQGTMAETAALKQLERSTLQELEREAAQAAASAFRSAREPDSAQKPAGTQKPAGVRKAAGAPEPAEDFALISAAAGAAAIQSGRDREVSEHNAQVGEELRSLRALLEHQLAALAWNDFTRREPTKARALTDLASLGLDRELALQIVDEIPAATAAEQFQRLPYALLARRVKVIEPPMGRSGALALIGPAGFGKTTTLSKLAARYVLEHDAANLVLISTDDERLGSQEQLRSLGRLLGARVEAAASHDEITARVDALPGRMILIDTAGVGARDLGAAARYRQWRQRCRSLQIMLAVSASAQGGVIDETIRNFGVDVAHCCVLTRVDEAVSLGGVLSSLVRSQLPVAYYCEGSRIPEDIRPARAHQLIARAMELSRQTQTCADDDLLARRYGRSVHAAA
jgi:flagellar biosynthesis protein FlhF